MSSKKKKSSIGFFVLFGFAVAFILTIFVLTQTVGKTDGEKIPDNGLQYNYMHVDIVFDDDRTCHVKNSFQGEFLENPTAYAPNHGLYVDIPVNSGERIENVTIDATANYSGSSVASPSQAEFMSMFRILRMRVGDGNKSFYIGNTLDVTVEYDYTFPKHKLGNDVLAVMAIGGGWTSRILDASVTVTFPAAPETADGDYGVYIAGGLVNADDARVEWSNDGKTVTVRAGELSAFDGVEVAYKMPDGTVGVPGINTAQIIVLSLGAVLLIAAILMKVFVMKNKPVTPVVDFYPPRIACGNGKHRHMLPVQMGKIIDDSCSKEDVTSLIFYWASKGYLQIDEREDDTYLIKLKNVDAVRDYERTMFNGIFKNAAENEDGKKEVSLGALSGKFYNSIMSTRSAVNREYKNKFYTPMSALGVVMSVICAIFAAGTGVLITFTVARGLFNLYALATLIPVIISYMLGSYIAKYYFKFSSKVRALAICGYAVLTALMTVALSMLIPTCVMGWVVRIPFCLIVAGISGIAPFLIKRTDVYTEQLNAILGFRNFLRDAEKEKLETMLEENPQYYYDILPYANVLGVSEIWSKKFEDLTIEPPTYIRSYRRYTFFDYYMFHRLARTVGSSLTYVEPKVSSGSFSSGGGSHGGSSGGGFSGGSFGGGGGGRW